MARRILAVHCVKGMGMTLEVAAGAAFTASSASNRLARDASVNKSAAVQKASPARSGALGECGARLAQHCAPPAPGMPQPAPACARRTWLHDNLPWKLSAPPRRKQAPRNQRRMHASRGAPTAAGAVYDLGDLAEL